MTPERKAIVACWLSHLLLHEADAIGYRHPPASEDEQRDAEAFDAMSHAAFRRACRFARLPPDSDAANRHLWRRAMDAWTPYVP